MNLFKSVLKPAESCTRLAQVSYIISLNVVLVPVKSTTK